MAELTEADRYLLDQIARGDAAGWAGLVSRYQGRLLAFARSRVRQSADAEDAVQEAFISFLKGLPAFRRDTSVETYLFTILRRKLADQFRGSRLRACSLQDTLSPAGDGDPPPDGAQRLAGPELTASAYARRDEQAGEDRAALAAALRGLLERFKESGNLRDLRVIEMLFYGQLRNKDVAAVAGIDEKRVAMLKHRCLNEIRDRVGGLGSERQASDAPAPPDSLLTEVWEGQRLTCPKRSTIGRFLLGTLDPPWQEYVDFHINRLGCRFCRANLEDLQRETAEPPATPLRDRILHSTVGFLTGG